MRKLCRDPSASDPSLLWEAIELSALSGDFDGFNRKMLLLGRTRSEGEDSICVCGTTA